MLRLFVALELPPSLRDALSRLQEPHRDRRDVRWANPATLHLTIKFLGDTAEDAVPHLTAALAETATNLPPLSLELCGFGVFPRRGPPRVLWVGVEGDTTRLVALAEAIDLALAPLGIPPEKRSYHPHITLGRVKRGRAQEAIAALSDLARLGGFEAHELVLFQSTLTPQGAKHEALANLPFGVQIPGEHWNG
jgi:2'-5' RNA ligase